MLLNLDLFGPTQAVIFWTEDTLVDTYELGEPRDIPQPTAERVIQVIAPHTNQRQLISELWRNDVAVAAISRWSPDIHLQILNAAELLNLTHRVVPDDFREDEPLPIQALRRLNIPANRCTLVLNERKGYQRSVQLPGDLRVLYVDGPHQVTPDLLPHLTDWYADRWAA